MGQSLEENRKKYPKIAEFIDLLREMGFNPKVIYLKDSEGNEYGHNYRKH